MMLFPPFEVIEWLNSQFENDNDAWGHRYPLARECAFRREEEERIAQKKRLLYIEIENTAAKTIDEDFEVFYLFVRNNVACKLANDIKDNPKYSTVEEPYMIEEKLVEQGNLILQNIQRWERSSRSSPGLFISYINGNMKRINLVIRLC